MTFEEIKKAWFKAKIGFVDESDLRLIKSEVFDDRICMFYKCPCGSDHYAMRFMVQEGYSQYPSCILNCFVNNHQWGIKVADVAAIIKEEEEKYLRLIERAPKIIKKVIAQRGMSEETLFFLENTHGIDREMVSIIELNL